MILMIDNYDSFTYNLVQYVQELKHEIFFAHNDQIDCHAIKQMSPSHIIISPGPGRPEDAGITPTVIKEFFGKIPILGVCLGHQAIAQAFGAKIIHAKDVMHGKTSEIYHDHRGVFHKLPMPFQATRYHSLVVEQESLPSSFEITAWTQEHNGKKSEVMGISHREYLLQGVQFHPESILTEAGHQLLQNFLRNLKIEH